MALACDQSPSATGWCYGDGNDAPTLGVEEHSFVDHEAELRAEVFQWARRFIRNIGAEYVFLESILIYTRRINIQGIHKQFAVYNAIALAAHDNGVPIRRIEPKAWRHRFIGRGDAPADVHERDRREWLKLEAMHSALDRAWQLNSHDAAEAGGLWDFGLASLDPEYAKRSEVARRRWLNEAGNEDLLRGFGA